MLSLPHNKDKEEFPMKATTIRPSRFVSYRRNTFKPYPNAAERRKLTEILTDAALAAAITVAVVVIGLFLLVLA